MHTTLYEKITQSLVEDGYIIIENAFDKLLVDSLLKNATDDKSYNKAAISQSSNAHVDSTKRSDKTKWIDEDGSVQSEYLHIMDGLKEYLNRSLYLGLNYYESHFAQYDKGDFYEKHLDAFQNSKNRVVTTVYYLNDNWSELDGGELILHDNSQNKQLKVPPKANTLVVFLSEKFPHEVLPAKRRRYSIAGWFRVDKPIF